MTTTSVETYTGQYVDLAKPDPKFIRIEDIAWHLSRIPRFVGATNSENVYNVAQHSVLVLNRVRQSASKDLQTVCFQLCALLHDGHEAYFGDFPGPASQLLDMKMPIKRLKERLQRAIYAGLFGQIRFNGRKFTPYVGTEIDVADRWARTYEAYHLMHSKGRGYYGRAELEEYEMYRNMIVWNPAQAEEAFLRHYEGILELNIKQ